MPSISLVSAGSNAQGQLASGDDEDRHTFSPCLFLGCSSGSLPAEAQRILQIAHGANHTLLLMELAEPSSRTRNEVWGAGDGTKGQLGPTISSAVSTFTPLDFNLESYGLQNHSVKKVAACWETSYIVLSSPGRSDVLLSCGTNDYGDLGIGGVQDKTSLPPMHVVCFEECVGAVDATVRVRRIDTGPHTVIVQLEVYLLDGTTRDVLVGWGAARHGQLGEWKIDSKNIAYLDCPRPLPLSCDDHIISFAIGSHHSMFLRSSGKPFGMGSSRKGQIESISDTEDVRAVGCTWNSTFVVSGKEGEWSILSCGASTKGQLGRDLDKAVPSQNGYQPDAVAFPFIHSSRKLVKLVCGSEHVLCLFSISDGEDESLTWTEVWAWGWNEHGNLGVGTTDDHFVPVKIWPPAEGHSPRAIDIAAGNGTSWIVLQ